MAPALSAESIEEFLSSMTVNGHSHNTIRGYRADLTGLLRWMEANPSKLPLEGQAATYLTAMRPKWQPKTMERKLTALRSWAKWAGAPAFLATYKAPKPARAEPHPLPGGIADVHRMVTVALEGDNERRLRDAALVALCGYCGLRVGEAIALRPSDYHRSGTSAALRFIGKGGVERRVPVPLAALPLIEGAIAHAEFWERGTIIGLKDRHAREVLTRLAERAGVARPASSHDLRATFGTEAYRHSKDLRAVQELLGHASAKTTEIYTAISDDAKRAAIEFIDTEREAS